MATKSRKPKSKKKARPEVVIDRDDVTMPLRWPARMHCAETDTGCVILTGDQARALMGAVDIALSVARPKRDSDTETNLLAAVAVLDHTFDLGICDCDCECDCECDCDCDCDE